MFSRLLSRIPSVQTKYVTNLVRSINSLSTSKPNFIQPSPMSLLLTYNGSNPHIWRQNDPMKLPVISQNIFELPTGFNYTPNLIDSSLLKEIEAPSLPNTNTPIEAARLIVIRRKKMKKHKLRKLRKRMKYEWAKLRQRRELKKEKAFQAVLIQQCKEAEAFSAENYVAEKLKKLNHMRIPKRWKGKVLPEAEIRKKLEQIGVDLS